MVDWNSFSREKSVPKIQHVQSSQVVSRVAFTECICIVACTESVNNCITISQDLLPKLLLGTQAHVPHPIALNPLPQKPGGLLAHTMGHSRQQWYVDGLETQLETAGIDAPDFGGTSAPLFAVW